MIFLKCYDLRDLYSFFCDFFKVKNFFIEILFLLLIGSLYIFFLKDIYLVKVKIYRIVLDY